MFRTIFLIACIAITTTFAATATTSVALNDYDDENTSSTILTDTCIISVWACGLEPCEYQVGYTGTLYKVSLFNTGDCDEEACADESVGFTIVSPCGFDDIKLIPVGVKVNYNDDWTRATFTMVDDRVGTLEIQLPYDDENLNTTGCGDWYVNTNVYFPSRSKEFVFRCAKPQFEYACKDEMVEICIDESQIPCVLCTSASLLSSPVNGLAAKKFEASLEGPSKKCFEIPLQYFVPGNNQFTLEWNGNDCPFASPCVGGGAELIEIDYACDCFTEESQTTIVCEYLEPKTIEYVAQSHCGDSIVHMTYVVLPSDTTYLVDQSCEPRDDHQEVYTNADGCDSLVITSFETIVIDTTFVQEVICEYQPDTTKVLTNIAGCDSIVMIRYQVESPDTTYLEKITCDSLDQNRIDTLLQFNQYGCDSLIITTFKGHVPKFGVHTTSDCGEDVVVEITSLDGSPIDIHPYDNNRYDQDGEVSYTIVNEFGCYVDTSIIIEYADQPSIELGPDRTVKLGEYVAIRPQVSSQEGLFFDSEQVDINQILKEENGRFQPIEQVTITAQIITLDGCDASDEIVISIEQDKKHEVFGPNVFSPNFDGINDYFTVFTAHQAAMINSLKVFDRWGNQVFLAENIETSKEILGWDGTYKGKQLNSGAFVYTCVLTFLDDVQVKIKGDFTILNH